MDRSYRERAEMRLTMTARVARSREELAAIKRDRDRELSPSERVEPDVLDVAFLRDAEDDRRG